jgi:membrane-bound serine protease (ClpP class)
MVAARRRSIRKRDRTLRLAWFLAAGLVVCLCLATASAQAPAREDGLFITVPNPITSDVVESVKAKTQRALERTDRAIRTIVFDFNSGDQLSGHPSSTKAYGPCHDLAAFLLEQQAVNTVAFVHHEVSAHTILPVLACKDIVMSSGAKIGNTQQDQPPRLLEDEVQFYEHVARSRGRCPAIVLKMIKPDLEVVEGTKLGGVWYVDRSRLAQERAQGFVLTGQEPVLPRGQLADYSAAEAQKFGLCSLVKETRTDVAERYGLTPSSLREDPLEGRDPRPFRIKLAEPLTGAVGERLRRQIRQAVGRQANVLILQLESSRGELTPALDLAEMLRNLKDDRGEFPVMTIAYIPREAPGPATILALGCNEIVMGPTAQIGDFSQFTQEERGWNGQKVDVDPERYRLLRNTLIELARQQGYSPLLAQGMLDRPLTIYQVQDQKNPAEWKLISQEEWDQDQAPQGPKKWGHQRLIKRGGPNGEFLKLDGTTARDVGLARDVADNFSDLCAKYGFKERDVRDMGYDFLYRFAEFLRHPAVALFLIMIGIACLILELKVPGVGLPGVIAAVCFVLYFWAHTQQLSGQIIALAVLLFVLGLVLIGLEIFLLPGSFVMGISGVALIVISLGLATLEKRPETTHEWLSFGQTLGAISASLVGAVTLAFLVAWYLPSIPYASRLILAPPGDTVEGRVPADELAEAGAGSLYPDLAPLLGAVGVATTTLRPAGIARFGDQFVDVVTEGSFVPAGSRLQVVEIEGNRVVVKEV